MIDAAVTTPSLATRASLRKSFRRTISAVSGFRLRMRTVFVPYILLHPTEPDTEVDHALAAGHTEHTVMLCVELEHPGEAPEAFLERGRRHNRWWRRPACTPSPMVRKNTDRDVSSLFGYA